MSTSQCIVSKTKPIRKICAHSDFGDGNVIITNPALLILMETECFQCFSDRGNHILGIIK